MEYLNDFINGYTGYANFLWQEITFGYDYKPWYQNYFYWLILVSLFFFSLEIARPWRKNQPKFRKDFWLDFFYMFFNFFLFWLIIYNAYSKVVVHALNDGIIALTGVDIQKSNPLNTFPYWSILLIGFLVRDFTQWWTHRLLHKVPKLWEFHKVHHSVKEMGFAAHLRYHWMETVVYRAIEYLPLALLGIGLYDFFIIHIFTLAWGHFNHSNIKVNLGPLKYLFNNPQMHIWHHAKEMPESHPNGINFGITLSIWDYIFKTDYIPHDGRDIELGFSDIEEFPDDFVGQITHGLPIINK
ncbi:MAG: sterol desaturase family protein [Saprospiraceae bacterium]